MFAIPTPDYLNGNNYLKSFFGVIPLVTAAAAITLIKPPAINGIVPMARIS